MGNHIKSLGDIQVDNVRRWPHINQAGSSVLRDNQVSQAQFVLGQSLQAFPNHGLHLTDGPIISLWVGVIQAFFQSFGMSP